MILFETGFFVFNINYLVRLNIVINFTNPSKFSPNIIVFITDDQGNADASFNYQITSPNKIPPIKTDNIDYLANRGIIFRRMYTQNVCSPTRVAFLSCRYPYDIENFLQKKKNTKKTKKK